MKFTDLFIEGTRQQQDLQLGPFTDGLTVICGDSEVGRTRVLEFFRDAFLGLKADFDPYGTCNQVGRLGLQFASVACELNRGQESRTMIKRRFESSDAKHWDAHALADYLAPVNSELFDSVFCVSFLETAANARRLAGVLHRQLGVPVGKGSTAQRDSQVRLDQLAKLRERVGTLELERREMLDNSQRSQEGQSPELSRFELEINNVVAAISEIGQQRAGLVSECDDLESSANLNSSRFPEKRSELNLVSLTLSSLYARLDHVEGQINRWRKFQLSVHEQRVQIRDEMSVWNSLTLDSDEHPYHHAREILVSLENKVDEVDRNGKHWGDAAAARVDTASMARTVGGICNSMREDLNGLCDELAHQYKHMRHKSAAAELRQLRALYGEIGSNLQRLALERKSLTERVRESDAFGANLISMNDMGFMASARTLGFEEARDRYFAETIAKANSAEEAEGDSQGHMTEINRRRSELLASARSLDTELDLLGRRHLALLQQRSNLTQVDGPVDCTKRVNEIDQKLISLRYQLEALSSQSEVELPPTNPIVEEASLALEKLTAGEFDAIWLGSSSLPEVSTEVVSSAIELMVRNRLGHEVKFSQLSAELQNRIYLACVFGAKNHLRKSGIELPTIIDHAFVHLSDDGVQQLLQEVEGITGLKQQMILLGRSIEKVPLLSTKVFEIPLRDQGAKVNAAEGGQDFAEESSVANAVDPEWQPEDFVTTEVYATGILPRPYPLSKYPRLQSQWAIEEDDSIVSLPFPVAGQRQTVKREVESSSARANHAAVSSVSVSMIGDRLGYASSINETTKLDRMDFFDSKQLRLFHAQGILSVGDLLVVDEDAAGELNLHSEQLDRWQAQLWLLMHVPGLRTPDAKVLVACGITAPEHLDTSFPQQILDRIERFFSTSEGRHFGVKRGSITLARINSWYRSLNQARNLSENESLDSAEVIKMESLAVRDSGSGKPRSRKPCQRTARGYQARDFAPDGNLIKSNRASKTARILKNGNQPRLARPPRMHASSAVAQVAPSVLAVSIKRNEKSSGVRQEVKNRNAKPASLKFYLDLSDHVEAAPSIGPKTAERFEKIGINTVAEFLKYTAESMEAKLKYKRISEKIIRVWQHQARLVCRIPNLRGHDSQLLVACGITEPETLATMQPQALYEIISPFSETKAGLKIIRNGRKPDLEEVSNWISWASNFRSIQAA